MPVATLPAILPFVFGGLIAYALLPVVDALDRLMPRTLAALLSVSAIVVAVVGIGLIVLPPLANAFVDSLWVCRPRPISTPPSRTSRNSGLDAGGLAAIAAPILTTIATAIRDAASGASGGLDESSGPACGHCSIPSPHCWA